MILVRFFLISLIVYLLVRSFMRFGEEEKSSSGNPDPERKNDISVKRISKEIGEVIDYEELDKK